LSTIPTKSFKVAKAAGDEDLAPFVGAVAKYSFGLANDLVSLPVGASTTVTHHRKQPLCFVLIFFLSGRMEVKR
jgi:hypothetical protein